jgi:CDP-diacylglycerol---glycerol-3-phosphate 3-phosphatidyltransferase
MSSVQNASQFLEPLRPAMPDVARLDGTLWARSMVARTFYRYVEYLAWWLSRLGVGANAITYASLGLALLSGISVGMNRPGGAAVLVLMSGCLDLLDGAVARRTGSASRWGALLDSTLDRVADAAPLAGVIFYYARWPWAATAPLLAVVASFLISYVRARAETLGTSLPSLFMRRAERVLLVAGSLALGTVSIEGAIPAPLMLAGVSLTGLLALAGAVSILVSAHGAMQQKYKFTETARARSESVGTGPLGNETRHPVRRCAWQPNNRDW